MNKKNFCIGISKPLNIFDKKIRDLIFLTLEKGLYVHTSITYPVNFFFIRHLLNKEEKDKINFICKILADNHENFIKTVNLTFKEFGLNKIHTLQLVNLPITNNYRKFNSVRNDEMQKILKSIQELKKNKKIEKVYVQIFSNDNLDFCKSIELNFDGFAFYANPKEIQLNKEVFEFIVKKNIPTLILSIFGNPEKHSEYDELHTDSFVFSQSYFTTNTIAVGRTSNLERLHDILNIRNYKNLQFAPKFLETNENQDTSQNYFKRYKVTNFNYILIFILKCLTKKVFGKKISMFLKKLYKK